MCVARLCPTSLSLGNANTGTDWRPAGATTLHRTPFDQISTRLKDINQTDRRRVNNDRGSLGHSVHKQPKERVSASESLTPQLNVDHEDASEAASEAANPPGR
jgi:hypothetical protein